MSDENKILNIKKLKIVCSKCKTEIIMDLGATAYSCPVCGQSFVVRGDMNYFIRLYELLLELKSNPAAEFSLICEREQE
ncbi:hypothetical protein [Campylobacter gastrosuis]|uniref:Uncharacterized protein n=1 Tax=Campylobacter gastrosuis TaxID=2974576 RepID=A0ABT7HT67_9BACT|nr:hypothetical protein [Campylobacter gastrosuis]MDL0089998.1 hypothetical protein [Campylobacter gastrosuis]